MLVCWSWKSVCVCVCLDLRNVMWRYRARWVVSGWRSVGDSVFIASLCFVLWPGFRRQIKRGLIESHSEAHHTPDKELTLWPSTSLNDDDRRRRQPRRKDDDITIKWRSERNKPEPSPHNTRWQSVFVECVVCMENGQSNIHGTILGLIPLSWYMFCCPNSLLTWCLRGFPASSWLWCEELDLGARIGWENLGKTVMIAIGDKLTQGRLRLWLCVETADRSQLAVAHQDREHNNMRRESRLLRQKCIFAYTKSMFSGRC